MALRREPTGVISLPQRRAFALGKTGLSPAKALVVVAALVVVVGTSNRLSTTRQAGAFGHLFIGVSSGSMAPRMDVGDLEVDKQLTRAESDHLHPGQIISFRSPRGSDGIMTSRIVTVAPAADGTVAYLTKADSSVAPDQLLAASADVIGVYQSTIPYGGYLLDALHRPLAIGLTLALLMVWLFTEPHRRRIRNEATAAHQELAFEDR